MVDFGTGPGSFGCSCLTFPKTLKTAGRLSAFDMQKKALFNSFQQTVRVLHPSSNDILGSKVHTVMLHNWTSGISRKGSWDFSPGIEADSELVPHRAHLISTRVTGEGTGHSALCHSNLSIKSPFEAARFQGLLWTSQLQSAIPATQVAI